MLVPAAREHVYARFYQDLFNIKLLDTFVDDIDISD